MRLNELMPIKREDMMKYKVHFATGPDGSTDALHYLSRNEFKEWQKKREKESKTID